ncbi:MULTISPECIES: tail fiber protein [Photorhabdus]|uniref:Sc/svq protein n=2 Tax=Photorhabdus asymbiotica TaxID=291112 RepID=B6VKW8_PHOAA|nr:tail fiber protein [Photorhabdus asymbiotica]RKS65736.1 tail fiber-like repeat protein [Photorhabdus asymbiotica]CAQ84377.1 sc/svq protein [Photorhabdus asymbiotica]CAR66798.1 sc/svq protein [Photorhabdus asymbiotica subsp. asymbiotica ATCC 43949]
MSQKNDFKAFSISNNANVVSQEKYEESQGVKTGFPPENIPIHVLNKVLRQSSTIASVVANFIAAQSDDDVLDDGNIAKLTDQLNLSLEQKITTVISNASLTQKGVVQLTNEMGNNDTLAVTQKLVQEIVNSLRENINGKVPNSWRINGKALTEDINLNASDVGAYTRAEVDRLIKKTSEIPVGSPIPWPLPHPPFGYVTCNGSAFNRSQYPKLAEAYPNGRLPDLRGEFIRGWDDGRGADNGRKLLSWQEGSALSEYLGSFTTGVAQNIHQRDGVTYHDKDHKRYKIPSLEIIGTGVDYFRFRPRNIAFNYIVKAE